MSTYEVRKQKLITVTNEVRNQIERKNKVVKMEREADKLIEN